MQPRVVDDLRVGRYQRQVVELGGSKEHTVRRIIVGSTGEHGTRHQDLAIQCKCTSARRPLSATQPDQWVDREVQLSLARLDRYLPRGNVADVQTTVDTTPVKQGNGARV